jgi:OmcA/MtrC family decaheme c-type cytochrome
MTSLNAREQVRAARPWLLLIACAALGLAACSGSNGKSGTAGPPGPSGPPGQPPPGTNPVGSAKVITATITNVTVPDDGKPLVEVRLTNESGTPLGGLPAGNIRFVLARLEPGNMGKSSTWHAITRKTEAFPGSPAPTPANRVTGTGPKNQATTETATAGTWTEGSARNGVYTYKFLQSLKGISDIPYDPNLVHRIGLEIRTSPNISATNIPANNATYTWIPTYGYQVESGREIVDNETCNACHDNLAVHGEARFDLKYCAMCHESYSFDAQSGNTIDLKVMIHKIHSGETLPSVEAGGFYGIFGFGNTFTDFSDVVFPQDKRNCQTCHRESDDKVPQASNWRKTVNTEACGACHDNVNWTTGVNHGGVAATNEQCETCHGPNSNIESGDLRPQVAHLIPENEAAKKFKFEVVRIQGIKADGSPGATACAAATKGCKVLPGEYPLVTIKVSDPTTGTPYKITDPAFTNTLPCTPVPPATTCTPTAARLRARVAYTTQNFTSPGSGSTPAQPIAIDYLATTAAPSGSPAAAGGPPTLNADGSYTKAGAKPMPSSLIGGTGEVFVEGRAIVDINDSPSVNEFVEAGVTASAGVIYPITDATAVARRSIVDVKKCDDCHQRLKFHGDARNDNTELCATCHNPENASGATLAAGRPFDFKLMIHGIHAATYSFGGLSFADVRYPGKLNNCEGCHKPDTYYPVDPTKVFATSITRGANAATPSDDIAYTPNVAVCSTCHTGSQAKLHMEQNGGSFNATKNADGTSNEAAAETCQTCHGPGRVVDVKVVHKVGEFQYN